MKRILLIVLIFTLILTSCSLAGDTGKAEEKSLAEETSYTGDKKAVKPEETATITERTPSYVKALVAELVSELGLNQMDDESAIRTAYEYVVTHYYFSDPVGLDIWRYLSDEVEAIPYIDNRSLSPLLFGIASCEDFAAVMVMIFSEIGIEAEYVAGFTLSVDQVYIDHAWLVVKLGDSWYHLDPQLEYNVVRNGMLQYRFFMKTDTEMIFDHRWGENLIAHWQEIGEEEAEVIRESHLVPACDTKYPSPLPRAVEMPKKPDYLAIDSEIELIKKRSNKGDLPPISLNIEPPILVRQYHITPPLLPQYYKVGQGKNIGYARGLLSQRETKAYDQLFATLSLVEETEFIFDPPLNSDVAQRVLSYLSDDCAQFFWADIAPVDNDYSRLNITFKGELSKEEVGEKVAELDSKVADLMVEAAGKSDYEKLLGFYDFVGSNAYYSYKSVDSDNAYGAIIKGTASCNGYSRAFSYLAAVAGIENIYIRGWDKKGTTHAWNGVNLEGSWYYVDVTWGRSSTTYGGAYHDFFCISLKEALGARIWDEGQYTSPLPQTNSDKYDYFNYHGYKINIDGSATIYRQIDEIARICNDQLARKDNLKDDYSYAFVELKAFGTEEDYEKWKSLYTKELFSILRAMEEDAVERNLGFSVSTNTEVSCYYNDKLQVVSFYPMVKKII